MRRHYKAIAFTLAALLLTASACTVKEDDASDTAEPAAGTDQPTSTPEASGKWGIVSYEDGGKKMVTSEWSNPITYPESVEGGKGFRDPFVLKVGDWWYLTGTMYPYFEGDQGSSDRAKGVPLYKTQDFENWEFVDIILKRPAQSEGKWYQMYFWAPELFLHNGRYYLTVNCSTLGHFDKTGGSATLQAVCIAVADDIEGPYTVLTEEKPYVYQNDAHLFKDDTGKVYLFQGGIYCCEIDLNTGKPVGNSSQVIKPVPNSKAWNAERSGVAFEGPYCLKRDGTYYLFYSTWARGYEIGVASLNAKTPLSARWNLDGLPFYGAINETACNTYGATYEPGYYVYDYYEAGHNSVFLGPDGCDWIAAHVYEDNYGVAGVKLAIDRLYFEDGGFVVKDNGGNVINGPTHGAQKVVSEFKETSPVKALDSWAWCAPGDDYTPPAYSDILFSNGWRESYPVKWNGTIDTSTAGTKVLEGVVTYDGRDYTCTLTVKVK